MGGVPVVRCWSCRVADLGDAKLEMQSAPLIISK